MQVEMIRDGWVWIIGVTLLGLLALAVVVAVLAAWRNYNYRQRLMDRGRRLRREYNRELGQSDLHRAPAITRHAPAGATSYARTQTMSRWMRGPKRVGDTSRPTTWKTWKTWKAWKTWTRRSLMTPGLILTGARIRIQIRTMRTMMTPTARPRSRREPDPSEQPKPLKSLKSSKPSKKVALITGGARRVGRAVCLRLAQAGYDIALTYRQSAAEAQELAQQLEQLGSAALTIEVDLADPAADAHIAEVMKAHFDRLDALVNNAAIFSPQAIGKIDLATYDHFQAVNARAPLMLMQRFADVGRWI